MAVKTKTYLQRIQQSQEDKLSEKQGWQVEDNAAQVEVDLKATRRALSEANKSLDALKSAVILDTGEILICVNEIEGLTYGIKTLEALQKELFPAT